MDEPGAAEVRMELPPLAEYVGTGRMVVGSLARRYGFSDEQVEDLKIATSEAITHAVRAHSAAGNPDPILIAVSMLGDAMTVTVTDGAGDLSENEVDLGATPLPGALEAGLGLSLIRALVPESAIEARDGGGTALTLTVKREGASE